MAHDPLLDTSERRPPLARAPESRGDRFRSLTELKERIEEFADGSAERDRLERELLAALDAAFVERDPASNLHPAVASVVVERRAVPEARTAPATHQRLEQRLAAAHPQKPLEAPAATSGSPWTDDDEDAWPNRQEW